MVHVQQLPAGYRRAGTLDRHADRHLPGLRVGGSNTDIPDRGNAGITYRSNNIPAMAGEADHVTGRVADRDTNNPIRKYLRAALQ